MGCPIHIGAALLGHLNLQTTQGYVAVFAEDVVAHYQEYLTHRRSLRPDRGVRPGQPRGMGGVRGALRQAQGRARQLRSSLRNALQHEHACIRCPMLQVNPKMLPRLAELEKDLLLRRKRAEEEQWLGEVEGIDATLTFLRAKQADAARLFKRPVIDLGLPTSRPEEAQ